jgi:hypothetical protein
MTASGGNACPAYIVAPLLRVHTRQRKNINTAYYPILVSLVKSDNTHGLIIPDILLGMVESSL